MIEELPESDEPAHALHPAGGEDDEVWQLVLRKLARARASLTESQSLAVLMRCIEAGEEAAKKAEGKDIVMIVGNTGAGKR